MRGRPAALFVNLLVRSAGLGSSVLLLLGVTQCISARGQGIYYLIQSLAATSFFFDLGIGYVLANLAGNTKASGHRGLDHLDLARRDRLSALFHFAVVWVACASLLYALVIGAAGLVQIRAISMPNTVDAVLWGGLVLGTACNLSLNALLNFFEGLGYAQSAGYVRFLQAITNGALFLLIVQGDPSPYVIGISMPVSVIFASVAAAITYRKEIRTLMRRADSGSPLKWRAEVLPFQWRIALSWTSGYFLFQAPTLLIGRSGALVDAGHFGLSMQIYLAAISVAQVYLTFCVSRWSALHENEDLSALFHEYLKGAVATCSMVAAAGATLVIGAAFGPESLVSRLASPQVLMLLLIGTAGFQLFIATNFYFRAQLKEALWSFSALSAVLMIALVALMDASSRIVGVSLAYMVTGVLLGVGSFIRAQHHHRFAIRRANLPLAQA